MADCKKGGGCCAECGPITINAEVTGQATIIRHDERDVMVVPVVAIVEGVLNGALVPAEEFGKYVDAWEGVPVPVEHPQIRGNHVSSNLPEILETRVIGRFHNVAVKGNKLIGELWIDVASAMRKGFEKVLAAFKEGDIMEVSTAYFADLEPVSGVFNGREYTGIHRNLRPDHLAVLPQDVGACSVQDGCGTFRNNDSKGKTMNVWEKVKALLGFETNASLGDKLNALHAALNANMPQNEMAYMIDAYDDSVVYEYNGALYRRSYTMGDDGAVEFGEPEKVRMEKNYVTANTVATESAEADGAVADNATDEPPQGENDEETAMSEKTQAPALDAESLTAVNWAKEQYEKRKAELTARIKANKSNAFSDEELAAMHVNALEKLDLSMNGAKPDFSGRGMPQTNASETEEVLDVQPFVLRAVGGDE